MEWSRIRRESGLVEHVCEHGVGHPNRGSALWLAEEAHPDGSEETISAAASDWRVHGCDGCCGRLDFPGTTYKALRHLHRMIRLDQQQYETESDIE